MIGTSIAEYLDALGLVDYRANGVGGDCFIDTTPQSPDVAVVIFGTGSSGSDFHHGYDAPTVQIMVRGGADPRVSHSRAVEIYEALHGLGHTVLPDGTKVLSCTAVQSAPIGLGHDDNGRHRHAINYQLDIYAPTALRPTP